MRSRRQTISVQGLLLAGLSVAIVSGCASTRSGGFDSADPGSRIDAIEETTRAWRRDPQPLPSATRVGIVESLRSDDELLRFVAIMALTEITGTSRGYRWDAAEAERVAAIPAWVTWAGAPDGVEVASR